MKKFIFLLLTTLLINTVSPVICMEQIMEQIMEQKKEKSKNKIIKVKQKIKIRIKGKENIAVKKRYNTKTTWTLFAWYGIGICLLFFTLNKYKNLLYDPKAICPKE